MKNYEGMSVERKLTVLNVLLGWVGEQSDSVIREVINRLGLTADEAEDCGLTLTTVMAEDVSASNKDFEQ